MAPPVKPVSETLGLSVCVDGSLEPLVPNGYPLLVQTNIEPSDRTILVLTHFPSHTHLIRRLEKRAGRNGLDRFSSVSDPTVYFDGEMGVTCHVHGVIVAAWMPEPAQNVQPCSLPESVGLMTLGSRDLCDISNWRTLGSYHNQVFK